MDLVRSPKSARKAMRRSNAAKAPRGNKRLATGTMEPPVDGMPAEEMPDFEAIEADAATDDETIEVDGDEGQEIEAEAFASPEALLADSDDTIEISDVKEADVESEVDSEAPRPRAKKKSEDDASFLAMYFREMAALDVLKPEQEFEAAQEIERLEVDIWVELLSYASATDYVLKLVETCLENALPEFAELRLLAAVVRKNASKQNQNKLNALATDVGQKLRTLDTDRQFLDVVISDLHRVKHQVPGRVLAERLPFSSKSKTFLSYLDRVSSADRTAAVARNEFVKSNLRLVVSIARRFNHGRMALADLIQEGNIGLMKAVERYDYRRGFRFSTYASWWIRHAISRALADKGREVRLPVHMIDAYHRLSKAKRELTAKLSRNPTSEELAVLTDIPAHKIEKMRSYLVDQSFSLDRPVNDEDGRHFVEFLQDPDSRENHPAEKMTTQVVTRELRTLLRDLKPIEADILRQRFGLEDDQELTLKEIGEKYNLSRERIRQLQEQALVKMRRALARKHML
jgi:RNA polymerase primary sigma factor